MFRRIDEIGGPLSHNNYPWGWTMAGNTPFKRWKREVHEGGVADPCIVRLPAAPAPRTPAACAASSPTPSTSFPTVLELAGLAPPAEIDGIAAVAPRRHQLRLRPRRRTAPSEPGRHHTQHFEMLGSRAIYHDGWKAVTFHPVGPDLRRRPALNAPWDDDVWELYHVAEDVSESPTCAAEFPEKVAELVALWWEEARRNDVLPLDNRVLEIMAPQARRPALQEIYRYFQDGAPVPEWVAVDVRNRSHAITVDRDGPRASSPDGTLLALGSALGGWSLHVLDGRLRYLHNLHGQQLYEVVGATALAPGRHEVEFRFEKDDGAGRHRPTLLVDGAAVGTGEVDRFTPVAFNEVGAGLTCGYEWGPAVGGDYEAPFPSTARSSGPRCGRRGRSCTTPWPRSRPSWPRSSQPRRRPAYSKLGRCVRVRLSSKKPSVPVHSSTPSHSRPAASPLGAGVTTGPKMA